MKDLDKLKLGSLAAFGGFKLKTIFTTAPAASKYDACFTRGQNWLKNNHLTSLVWIFDTLYYFENMQCNGRNSYFNRKWQLILNINLNSTSENILTLWQYLKIWLLQIANKTSLPNQTTIPFPNPVGGHFPLPFQAISKPLFLFQHLKLPKFGKINFGTAKVH